MLKIAIPLVVFSGLIIVGNWYVAANANYEAEKNSVSDTPLITTIDQRI